MLSNLSLLGCNSLCKKRSICDRINVILEREGFLHQCRSLGFDTEVDHHGAGVIAGVRGLLLAPTALRRHRSTVRKEETLMAETVIPKICCQLFFHPHQRILHRRSVKSRRFGSGAFFNQPRHKKAGREKRAIENRPFNLNARKHLLLELPTPTNG